MVRIKWTEQAKFDLKDIADYISKGSLKYAKITVINLRLRTNILKSHIRTGTVVPEYEIEFIRELIEGNYRIIYFINNENLIEILAVIHGARDLTKIKLG